MTVLEKQKRVIRAEHMHGGSQTQDGLRRELECRTWEGRDRKRLNISLNLRRWRTPAGGYILLSLFGKQWGNTKNFQQENGMTKVGLIFQTQTGQENWLEG